LIIVEPNLPAQEDGWALIKQIKAQPAYQDIAVIILSHSEKAQDIAYVMALVLRLISPDRLRFSNGWLVLRPCGGTGGKSYTYLIRCKVLDQVAISEVLTSGFRSILTVCYE